jgi:hypothetical protein
MVKLLDEPEKDVKCLAAETIGKKNVFHSNKKILLIYI